MCGRINMALDPADLVDELDINRETVSFPARYNVPPGSVVPIVLDRENADGEVIRRLEPARWGLVPSWAKEEKIGFRAFNARSETVAEKPMFRSALADRRCVVPVHGYYEWQKREDGKQPWFMHAARGDWLFMLGLYETRKLDASTETAPYSSDPAVHDGWLVSTTIITAPAVGRLHDIHDRVPVMISEQQVSEWLDQSLSKERALSTLHSLIDSFDPESVDLHRVGSAVGNVRNDGPELSEPVGE